ncbi:MAG: glycosyltransferase family 2 protein [Bacteroidales bacterium]|nr:glycosyltransferase family 2 protein [Bacteroidales bacterium]
MNKVKLSVVIITYNEENNIERCLKSVIDVADEIVVVDSFSTDKTKEICLSYGVKFIEHKFEGHIQQKNYAITQASYPHILSLDADEALSEELKKNILKIKENWQYDGYYVNRITNYCGKWIKHGSWYPDWKLRLWYAPAGEWKGVNPHDKFELNKNCKTTKIKGHLYHYSYRSVSDHIKQIEYFTNIAANASYQNGKRANILKILFYPIWKFKRDYFFNLGFLDGYYGFVIAAISAFGTFLKYIKIYEIQKKHQVKKIAKN